jgi:hypothetical protein
MYVSMYIYIYIYTYIHTYIVVPRYVPKVSTIRHITHTYIHTYIHTHTHLGAALLSMLGRLEDEDATAFTDGVPTVAFVERTAENVFTHVCTYTYMYVCFVLVHAWTEEELCTQLQGVDIRNANKQTQTEDKLRVRVTTGTIKQIRTCICRSEGSTYNTDIYKHVPADLRVCIAVLGNVLELIESSHDTRSQAALAAACHEHVGLTS